MSNVKVQINDAQWRTQKLSVGVDEGLGMEP